MLTEYDYDVMQQHEGEIRHAIEHVAQIIKLLQSMQHASSTCH